MGGLVTTQQTNLCDGFAELVGKYFMPSHVRDDPLIHTGDAMQGKNTLLARYNSQINPQQGLDDLEQKGDLINRDLW